VILMNNNFNDQHISLLINAFQNDPMFTKLFKGSRRNHQMNAFFKFIFIRNQLMNGIYLTDSSEKPNYVAFIEIPKNKQNYTFIRKVRLLLEMLRLVFYIPLKSLNYLSQYDSITAKQRPREKHYYLTMIGVSSEKQGQGFGKQAIDQIHQIASENLDVPIICLDTENVKNVSYYERIGYRLTNRVEVSKLTIYFMKWEK
jgi:ribosomal protein S18 acetylase RimI-like enzyme